MTLPYAASTFRRILRDTLVAGGWSWDLYRGTLTHEAAGLRIQWLSGKSVRVRRADDTGPAFSSRLDEGDAALAVAAQVHAFVRQTLAQQRAAEDFAASLQKQLDRPPGAITPDEGPALGVTPKQ